jgi:hypothetical protein
MAKIKRDIIGLYTNSGGYIVRPSDTSNTLLKEEDVVRCYHHGGSNLHTIKYATNDKETWYSNSIEYSIYKYAKDSLSCDDFINFLKVMHFEDSKVSFDLYIKIKKSFYKSKGITPASSLYL